MKKVQSQCLRYGVCCRLMTCDPWDTVQLARNEGWGWCDLILCSTVYRIIKGWAVETKKHLKKIFVDCPFCTIAQFCGCPKVIKCIPCLPLYQENTFTICEEKRSEVNWMQGSEHRFLRAYWTNVLSLIQKSHCAQFQRECEKNIGSSVLIAIIVVSVFRKCGTNRVSLDFKVSVGYNSSNSLNVGMWAASLIVKNIVRNWAYLLRRLVFRITY